MEVLLAQRKDSSQQIEIVLALFKIKFHACHISSTRAVCFVYERARAPRHFCLGKGHPLMKLKICTGAFLGHQGNDHVVSVKYQAWSTTPYKTTSSSTHDTPQLSTCKYLPTNTNLTTCTYNKAYMYILLCVPHSTPHTARFLAWWVSQPT